MTRGRAGKRESGGGGGGVYSPNLSFVQLYCYTCLCLHCRIPYLLTYIFSRVTMTCLNWCLHSPFSSSPFPPPSLFPFPYTLLHNVAPHFSPHPDLHGKSQSTAVLVHWLHRLARAVKAHHCYGSMWNIGFWGVLLSWYLHPVQAPHIFLTHSVRGHDSNCSLFFFFFTTCTCAHIHCNSHSTTCTRTEAPVLCCCWVEREYHSLLSSNMITLSCFTLVTASH